MAEELTFVRLKEYNEWEGETWYYWLQLNGNEETLAKLAQLLDSNPELSEAFTLTLDRQKSEDEVDDLVEQAVEDYEDHGGYTYNDHKVTGIFEWPAVEKSTEEWEEELYKGGIEEFFKEVK